MKNSALAILIIVFFGAGCARTVTPIDVPQPRVETVPATSSAMVEDKKTPETVTQETAVAEKVQTGTYAEYSTETLHAEQQKGQKVVLFFHAPWCPYCRAADAAFRANTDAIPPGVTVLKIDYDSSKALNETYGVNYQHTFVQIDAQGNLVTKWLSGDIDLLVKNIE